MAYDSTCNFILLVLGRGTNMLFQLSPWQSNTALKAVPVICDTAPLFYTMFDGSDWSLTKVIYAAIVPRSWSINSQ